MSMRLIPGADLAHRLHERGGSLPPAEAVTLVGQIAAALDAAHAAGLVHRDVKPGNVLVGISERDPHSYVADFGLVKHSDAKGLTASGAFLGTPGYCAPEQITNDRVGPAADVYALGVLLVQLLTGGLPFDADSVFAMLWKQMHDDPVLPSARHPSLAPFDRVVEQALRRDPGERFATAGALAAAAASAVVERTVTPVTSHRSRRVVLDYDEWFRQVEPAVEKVATALMRASGAKRRRISGREYRGVRVSLPDIYGQPLFVRVYAAREGSRLNVAGWPDAIIVGLERDPDGSLESEAARAVRQAGFDPRTDLDGYVLHRRYWSLDEAERSPDLVAADLWQRLRATRLLLHAGD